jgi:hypothetical protein
VTINGAQRLEPGPEETSIPTVPDGASTAILAPTAPKPEPVGAVTAQSGASLVNGVDLSRLPTKRAKFAALVATVPADDRRPDKEIIGELAPLIELNPGTARRYLADLRRAA